MPKKTVELPPRKPCGFAALTTSRVKEICAQGGKAVLRKYGKKHFRDIGSRGGMNSHGGDRKRKA